MNPTNIEESLEENLWESPVTENTRPELSQVDPWTLPSVPFDKKHTLPNISGVYFCLKDKGVLYIGISSDLQSRWKGHHRFEELRSLSCQRIAFLAAEESDLFQFEIDLINMFSPRLNRQNGRVDRSELNKEKQKVEELQKKLNEMRELLIQQKTNASNHLINFSSEQVLDYSRKKLEITGSYLEKIHDLLRKNRHQSTVLALKSPSTITEDRVSVWTDDPQAEELVKSLEQEYASLKRTLDIFLQPFNQNL